MNLYIYRSTFGTYIVQADSVREAEDKLADINVMCVREPKFIEGIVYAPFVGPLEVI